MTTDTQSKKKKATQIAKVTEQNIAEEKHTTHQASNPLELISHAVMSGQVDIETIKELRALQKEMKADAAQEAFVQAMAQFQSECPIIRKTKEVKNKSGQTVYFYAPLDSVIAQVSGLIAKNGLSYTFDTSSDDKELTASCKVTHVMGHTEITTFKVPIGSESYMTDVQKFGARATFAKRNAFCNAFGISTGDEDTDGTQTDKDKQAKEVGAQIIFKLRSLGHKTTPKEEVVETIKTLTGLEATKENQEEINNRLSVLVEEMNADKSNVE
jgi:hypothetical protein